MSWHHAVLRLERDFWLLKTRAAPTGRSSAPSGSGRSRSRALPRSARPPGGRPARLLLAGPVTGGGTATPRSPIRPPPPRPRHRPRRRSAITGLPVSPPAQAPPAQAPPPRPGPPARTSILRAQPPSRPVAGPENVPESQVLQRPPSAVMRVTATVLRIGRAADNDVVVADLASPATTPSCAGPARRLRDRRPRQPQRHLRQRPAGQRRAGHRGRHHRHRPGHVPAGRRASCRSSSTPATSRWQASGPDRHAAQRQGAPRPRQLPARRALPARRDRPQRRRQVHPARRADRHAPRPPPAASSTTSATSTRTTPSCGTASAWSRRRTSCTPSCPPERPWATRPSCASRATPARPSGDRRIAEVLEELALTRHAETRTVGPVRRPAEAGQRRPRAADQAVPAVPGRAHLRPGPGPGQVGHGDDGRPGPRRPDGHRRHAQRGQPEPVRPAAGPGARRQDRLLRAARGGPAALRPARLGRGVPGLRGRAGPGLGRASTARSPYCHRTSPRTWSAPAPVATGPPQAPSAPPASRNRLAQLSTLARRYLAVIASDRGLPGRAGGAADHPGRAGPARPSPHGADRAGQHRRRVRCC